MRKENQNMYKVDFTNYLLIMLERVEYINLNIKMA